MGWDRTGSDRFTSGPDRNVSVSVRFVMGSDRIRMERYITYPGEIHAALKKFELFHVGGLRPPTPPFKVGRIRGLRNDGLVHGPWPRHMTLAHWSRVPGPWALAWARVRPWSMGPGPWPWPGEKKKNVFLLKKKTCFSDFISTVPGNVEMKSPAKWGSLYFNISRKRSNIIGGDPRKGMLS